MSASLAVFVTVSTVCSANVRVLSNSWGGAGFSQSLLTEINRANSNDILFVAAAGNSAKNADTAPEYPAAYIAANLISVAATNNNDTLASFSNYGSWVEAAAPGSSIFSTWLNSGYNTISGTSMATPHVSGLAGLLASQQLTNAQIRDRISQLKGEPVPVGPQAKKRRGRKPPRRGMPA